MNVTKPNSHHIVALIPAYNEDRFIGSVVLKTKCYVDTVVVVDDCSKDQTAQVASAAGATVIRHSDNMGKAAALNTAFHKARELDASVIILLDGDGQHYPEDIPTLLQPILEEKAHLVVGSRFIKGHVAENIPGWRVIGQHSLNAMTNILSGHPLTDSQSGFRAFSRNVLDIIEFRQGGFTAESEMQFMAREHKWQTLEVPIRVSYEEGPKRNPFTHAMQVINGMLRLAGQSRPLLFFGIPGTVVLAAGLILGGVIINSYNATSKLAIGHALITIMLIMLGASSLFTGIILHSILGLLRDFISRRKFQGGI